MVEQRKRVGDLIGRKRLREILQMIPPRIEEVMQMMHDRDLFVCTRSLEREFKLGRLHPSEYYWDKIADWHRSALSFAKGMDEINGAL